LLFIPFYCVIDSFLYSIPSLQWIMMYMLDDEGFRSRGGGMFSNIFRMHGGCKFQSYSVTSGTCQSCQTASLHGTSCFVISRCTFHVSTALFMLTPAARCFASVLTAGEHMGASANIGINKVRGLLGGNAALHALAWSSTTLQLLLALLLCGGVSTACPAAKSGLNPHSTCSCTRDCPANSLLSSLSPVQMSMSRVSAARVSMGRVSAGGYQVRPGCTGISVQRGT